MQEKIVAILIIIILFAGCLEGTYGENCARDCSQGCINSTCDADSGECDCVDSYVGATCDNIGKMLFIEMSYGCCCC